MKNFRKIAIGILFSIVIIACNKNDDSNSIEASGIIQLQGITTYQYGTHTISSGYALRSSTLNLDDYINQNVTVVGKKIDGYPVDGGPDYLEVEKVK